ncbi:hypothetical protein [Cupriavidus sp.]|uniref:hypothetical protein n=1 Tax=Cupriavidus sp. TaxID=1873897 RepID=UPI0028BEE74A|nr:hypothetical protein [Cupriavidus sp.]
MTPLEETPANLIRAQDAPILHAQALQDRLQPFTVPIFRFRRNVPEPVDSGSGVLLNIGEFYFVLTAGHCVTGDFDSLTLGVRNHPHRFSFEPANRNYVCIWERGDFGYFQVSPDSVGTIAAGNRVFLTERSVEVLSVSEHEASRDFLALAGYPLNFMANTDDGTGARLLVYSTTMAGGQHAPASTLVVAGGENRREIHAWIPQQDNVDTLADDRPPVASFPRLHGASGGGWWSTHMNRAAWQASDVKLIGTHVGMSPQVTETEDGLRHRFSRVSLVGNHLALIARDYPALRQHILDTWPSVGSYGADLPA